ncbi:metal ABC transporter ATP-binding protein [Sphaerospermopsis aphanizomenoides BCCUSP55]|uniref:metal ABC transporter ATP-binding protein n=1 Tax=Sphaerospermopsis aphanizomenoides TaxID=459663 RepID=UPI001906AD40|nr:metal ABC transporter ATP-binding protein [Sphaerospermopsis aphanizomenoides]MBK1990099.1 metal ABC transporter ATP-binding protein [Sphaerospermopsis aphanizomenoides BCCUSP55]
MTLPILKVEGLTVYQGNFLAVRDVSFELFPGTDTAIVGPNGAGKSTLVKAILDLIPRSAGTIEIFGRPISRLGNLRNQLGYMPQNFIFDRSFPISVSELVGLGIGDREQVRQSGLGGFPQEELPHSEGVTDDSTQVKRKNKHIFFPQFWQNYREKTAAVKAALQRTDAYHLRNQAIGTLSGGQLKRVLLAYCLVTPRKLLVLDEAFAGVDMQGAADFYSLLNELKREEGWTVLQVSHDIDMVNRHCDRVLCLNQTVVCTGHPEIALSPQNLLATYGPGFSRYQHKH